MADPTFVTEGKHLSHKLHDFDPKFVASLGGASSLFESQDYQAKHGTAGSAISE